MNKPELKAAMARKGVSAQKLAFLVDMPYCSMLRKINGETSFTIEEAEEIGHALDLTNDEKCIIFL